MTRLCLVRHTTTRIDPDAPAAAWDVTDEGRARVAALAPVLSAEGIDLVVTSPERKATVTASILAQAVHARVEETAGLAEQGYPGVPYIGGTKQFTAAVQRHFAMPGQATLGEEASADAAARFDGVVREVLTRPAPPHLPAFVSHGRIISAWLARTTGEDAFAIWQTLQMPDALLVDLDQRTWRRLTPPGLRAGIS